MYCYPGTYEGSGTLSWGGYLWEAHPPHSLVTGARGRGEGGLYKASNTRERERGEDAKGRRTR